MRKILVTLLCVFCLFALVACEQPEPPKNTDWETVTQPTCTTDGKKQRYVDDVLQEETIPALGHDFPTEWTVTQKETCTTDGNEQRKCTRCPQVENRAITAHHELKDEQVYNWDEHYYECENCSEKIDLANHQFNVSREEKYAYFLSFGSTTDVVNKISVGYIDTFTCSDCGVVIKDAKLISKYDQLNPSGYLTYAKMLNVPTDKYNILHGMTIDIDTERINFEYDADYNITKVQYSNTYATDPQYDTVYTYSYQDGKLHQIQVKSPFVTTIIYIDFDYSNDGATMMVSRNNHVYRVYELDANGVITKETAYTYINGETQVKKEESIYNAQGYIQTTSWWQYYGDSGELSREGVYQFEYSFDANGNALSITKHYNSTESVNITYTYNNDGQIALFTYGREEYSFHYQDGKLVKIECGISQSTVQPIVTNYQYGQNKVSVYDSSNVLKYAFEYISERTMAE